MIDHLPSGQPEIQPTASSSPVIGDIRKVNTEIMNLFITMHDRKKSPETNKELHDNEKRSPIFRSILENIDDDSHLKHVQKTRGLKEGKVEFFSEATITELERIFRKSFGASSQEAFLAKSVRYFNRTGLCVLAALLENRSGLTLDQLHQRTGYAAISIQPSLGRIQPVLAKSGMKVVHVNGVYRIEG